MAIAVVLAGRERGANTDDSKKNVVFYTVVLLHPPDEICHVKLELLSLYSPNSCFGVSDGFSHPPRPES